MHETIVKTRENDPESTLEKKTNSASASVIEEEDTPTSAAAAADESSSIVPATTTTTEPMQIEATPNQQSEISRDNSKNGGDDDEDVDMEDAAEAKNGVDVATAGEGEAAAVDTRDDQANGSDDSDEPGEIAADGDKDATAARGEGGSAADAKMDGTADTIAGERDESSKPDVGSSSNGIRSTAESGASTPVAGNIAPAAPAPSSAPPSESTTSAAPPSESTTSAAPPAAESTTSAAPAPVAAEPAPAATAAPPPPIMRGTLSYDIDQRRHLIRGMWNYENSTVFPPQRFELVRNLSPEEDLKVLPKDGEFHGSFSLAYFHTTSKGKQKERSKVIPETGVKIKFTKVEGKEGEYQVDGKGTNQFGIFHINGTASKSQSQLEDDPSLQVVLRKRYEPSEQAAATTSAAPAAAAAATDAESGPLPEPSKSFPSGVVCLRGKLYKEDSAELGLDECVHRINGMWSSGLDLLQNDPQNARGLCNRFEYEHKTSNPSVTFPVSGRFSGWFDLSNEDGSRTRINERDVTLKFRKNNAGYHNVEGKGSNVFGKYSISGTLTKDNIITIFRHFQPRKIKVRTGASAAAAASAAGPARKPPVLTAADYKLKLDDVNVPGDSVSSATVLPITPPANGTYSAVSRGVLRVNEDGSHSCQGKWAVTREHFTNGQTSNFNFRLESHFAAETLTEMKKKDPEPRQFPLDSPYYKGSFQLKKQGSRYQTIVDQQIVMKFRRNAQGSFNVHGKGTNAIGEFNLIGTMVMSGKTGGQVELYRMYPPDKLAAPPAAPKSSVPAEGGAASTSAQGSGAAAGAPKLPGPPPTGPLQRRESSRMVKLPSRLEDDDPSAQLSRVMDKCAQILRIIRERDLELGAYFSEPVDPVALGIPTYHQIVKEPMDLRTIHRKMEGQEISSPEDFSRLVRLVFQNAMTFNIDPAHAVHMAARNLLVLFNQKFRDVERMLQNIRRTPGGELEEKGKKKGKDDKKRKRQSEEPKSLKRRRMEEAQAMAAANASAVAAIVAAAPSTNSATVTRSEFNMLLHLIQQLQKQVVETHTALADLSPGNEGDAKPSSSTAGAGIAGSASSSAPPTTAPAPAPERKKPTKRKSEAQVEAPAPIVDDDRSLSLAEQEHLTETINQLPPQHLGGVIQIIREGAGVGTDEDEIDLEIDQLDKKTQRKLLRHVSKFVKKPKAKPKKKTGAAASSKGSRPAKKAKQAAAPAPAPAPVPASTSFFAINKNDSDSDDDSHDTSQPKNQVAPSAGTNSKEFQLTTEVHHDDDDDHEDDLGSGSLAANWNKIVTASSTEADAKATDGDDDWGAAREQAAVAKAREAERKAREEKIQAEAEKATNERLAAAAARGEEIKAKRAEEMEKEEELRKQQEKEAEEAREAARAAARAQVQSVEQTVDLDAQRDIMKQYEQSFLDKDLGSASPSSDFGF